MMERVGTSRNLSSFNFISRSSIALPNNLLFLLNFQNHFLLLREKLNKPLSFYNKDDVIRKKIFTFFMAFVSSVPPNQKKAIKKTKEEEYSSYF